MNTQDELVCYAISFISFLLSNKKLWKSPIVKNVILFGSVARGDFDDYSDIDLFIDIYNKKDEKKVEQIVEKQQISFSKSQRFKEWKLKGVQRNIRCMVGVLDEWKLKRSIISDGIVLYGKYAETPEGLKQHALFAFKPIRKIKIRNRIIRKLFGYQTKKGKKTYIREGLVGVVGGKVISPRAFIIPIEQAQTVLKLLQKEKVDYQMSEIWIEK